MQTMRMHRSDFHVNLIPPSQVSIKTRKKQTIYTFNLKMRARRAYFGIINQ